MAGVPVAMRRPWQQQWSQTTYTNDQGVFRFPNLESGAWILAAIPSFTFEGPASASKPKPGYRLVRQARAAGIAQNCCAPARFFSWTLTGSPRGG